MWEAGRWNGVYNTVARACVKGSCGAASAGPASCPSIQAGTRCFCGPSRSWNDMTDTANRTLRPGGSAIACTDGVAAPSILEYCSKQRPPPPPWHAHLDRGQVAFDKGGRAAIAAAEPGPAFCQRACFQIDAGVRQILALLPQQVRKVPLPTASPLRFSWTLDMTTICVRTV